MSRISQREAQRTRRELRDLRARMNAMFKRWGGDWPGEHIGSIVNENMNVTIVKTARKLGHAVVCTVSDDGRILLYGVRP